VAPSLDQRSCGGVQAHTSWPRAAASRIIATDESL
jgi:hypothetical protein